MEGRGHLYFPAFLLPVPYLPSLPPFPSLGSFCSPFFLLIFLLLLFSPFLLLLPACPFYPMPPLSFPLPLVHRSVLSQQLGFLFPFCIFLANLFVSLPYPPPVSQLMSASLFIPSLNQRFCCALTVSKAGPSNHKLSQGQVFDKGLEQYRRGMSTSDSLSFGWWLEDCISHSQPFCLWLWIKSFLYFSFLWRILPLRNSHQTFKYKGNVIKMLSSFKS